MTPAISRDRLRLDWLVAQKTTEKPRGGRCVPSALDDEVQDFAFVVDGAPPIHALSADRTDHLVRMPSGRWSRPTTLQSLGNQRSGTGLLLVEGRRAEPALSARVRRRDTRLLLPQIPIICSSVNRDRIIPSVFSRGGL